MRLLTLWTLGTLALDAGVDSVAHVDTRVATALNVHATVPVTTLLSAVTELGSTAVLLPLTVLAALFLALRGRWNQALLVVCACVGAQVLTLALKLAFRRERPSFPDPLASASGFSFPSGHALISLSVLGALACVVAGRLTSRLARLGCFAVAALLTLAIGFSRLYLGVHYLSDVLAGYSVGLAWLLVCVTVLSRAGRAYRRTIAGSADRTARRPRFRYAPG